MKLPRRLQSRRGRATPFPRMVYLLFGKPVLVGPATRMRHFCGVYVCLCRCACPCPCLCQGLCQGQGQAAPRPTAGRRVLGGARPHGLLIPIQTILRLQNSNLAHSNTILVATSRTSMGRDVGTRSPFRGFVVRSPAGVGHCSIHRLVHARPTLGLVAVPASKL